MKTQTIKQTATFYATPEKVYNALLDSKKHAEFTDANATIDKKVDGKFTVYDGYCHGYIIELEKDKKIVQAWHFAEDGWPDDHYSICIFELKKIDNKTKLTFTQQSVPEHKVVALSDGWKEYYWKPLKEYVKS